MESIIETFHIDWKVIVAQALNFGIVFVVLYVYALKPLGKLMKERSEKIEQGVEDAKTNSQLLSKTKEEYDLALAEAKLEAGKIFKAGKKEAEEKRTLMLEEARAEVAGIIDSGKKTLEVEKVKMVEEARREVAALSIQMMEKVLKKQDLNLDKEVKEELANI